MLICNRCGEVFEESEADVKSEYDCVRGNSFASGRDYYLKCPRCGNDDLDEAEQCKCCEEWFREGELSNELCKECIADKKVLENALGYGETIKDQVSINGFWTTVFTPEEIEEVLKKVFDELPQYKQRQYIDKFCDWDIDCFAEWCSKRC